MAASNIARLLNGGRYYGYSARHVKLMNRKIQVRFEGSVPICKLGHYRGWVFGNHVHGTGRNCFMATIIDFKIRFFARVEPAKLVAD